MTIQARQLKFRGISIDSGKWVYGYLSFRYVNGKNQDGFIYTDKAQIYSQENSVCYDVFWETVGQNTGLQDMQLKEIYEGDIVIPGVIDENCTVERDQHRACFTCRRECGTFRDIQNVQEVVGNIYENPDIFKDLTKNDTG